MSSIPPIDELEINQDLVAQHTTWAIQRLGWVAIALFVAAALSGLFGNGPLARTTVTDSRDWMQVEYDRFGRYEGNLLLQVTIAPPATADDRITLWMDRAYWTSLAVDGIIPQPVTSSTALDGFTYVFAIGNPHVPAVVLFHVRPESLGTLQAQLRLNDQSTIRFRQFIYP
jgi:hypothetical protein